MFATLLAGLAVVISLQALRLASRDRIIIQVLPEQELAVAPQAKAPQLPPFLAKAQATQTAQAAPSAAVQPPTVSHVVPQAFQPGPPVDVRLN